MLELDLHLQTGNSYQNSGSFFSRSLLLKTSFQKHQNGLLLSSEAKNIKIYALILQYLQINLVSLEFHNDLVQLCINHYGHYSLLTDDRDIPIPSEKDIIYQSLELHVNQEISQESILERLGDLGYEFREFRSSASYQKSGDSIHITSPCGQFVYHIEFWGNTIDNLSISEIFAGLKRHTKSYDKYVIGNCQPLVTLCQNEKKGQKKLETYLIEKQILIYADQIQFSMPEDFFKTAEQNIISFDLIKHHLFSTKDAEIEPVMIKNIDMLKEKILAYKQVHIYTKNTDTIGNFTDYNDIKHVHIHPVKLSVLESFQTSNILVICDDILGRVFIKKRIRKNLSSDMDLLMKIRPDDYVVHIDHGIGIFRGIIQKQLDNITKEYIEIAYKDEEKLFVPILEVGRVSKYVGVEHPKLTGLGGTSWEKSIKSASQDATKIAAELLEIYSKRKQESGYSFKTHRDQHKNFIDSFGHIYTEDQSEAVDEILTEMSESSPMDRLLVGDVGFGKTEVAFHAIYNAFLNKKQSILITPLVVLAYEHYEKAKKRFEGFGIHIALLTRFETDSVAKQVLAGLSDGSIDLVIGTHRLLSDQIIYKDLGLMVIDEEHKFGVKDKEKIKKLKSHIDVLALSATPIPRSLHMALSSIRSMSTLRTPPSGRKDIDTSVLAFQESFIQDACQREFDRGGQVFFIHNRVSNIEHIKKILLNLFPERKVIIAHGQLSGDTLEKRIIAFKERKYDILLSTTVIENGIDFANVNTIFINDAGNFGISQIHQLRGRVGRSDLQGYCYLLYSKQKLSNDGAKRLQTIVQHSYLGAGFELAMKDLEIRGGGDLLGIAQSGQKTDIGVNLFLKMVEEKVTELRDDIADDTTAIPAPSVNTEIELNIDAALPDGLFASPLDKINFYREAESVGSLEELASIQEDFMEQPDTATRNFFDLLKLKILASARGIAKIKRSGIYYQITFKEQNSLKAITQFLETDREVHFSVINPQQVRSPRKNFENPSNFLQYLLTVFQNKKPATKIKIKKKLYNNS